MFLKLDRRRCLVVGAGRIATPKIRSLVAAGAFVRVIAPEASLTVKRWAHSRRLRWEARPFSPADLKGAFLVVAATRLPKLNHRVYREAQRRGVLCNVVDDPPRCDFYYPAVVRRGPLQIAVSTSGCSPALAKKLRQQLAAQFGPEYGAWVARIGRLRRSILSSNHTPQRRLELLLSLARGGPHRTGRRAA
jgi:precorrin-2 dehydrogenase/sirohydrochlorin ferrochelatase